MRRMTLLTVLAALVLPPGLYAQTHRLETLMARYLYSPNVIMEHQNQLDLTEDQQVAIRTETNEFQEGVQDFQWELERKMQDLALLVADEAVDVSSALELFEEVIELEAQIKRRHMRLLINIKNLLNAEQQAVLQEVMEEMLRRGEGERRGQEHGEGREHIHRGVLST